jgi:hypothetical protein
MDVNRLIRAIEQASGQITNEQIDSTNQAVEKPASPLRETKQPKQNDELKFTLGEKASLTISSPFEFLILTVIIYSIGGALGGAVAGILAGFLSLIDNFFQAVIPGIVIGVIGGINRSRKLTISSQINWKKEIFRGSVFGLVGSLIVFLILIVFLVLFGDIFF